MPENSHENLVDFDFLTEDDSIPIPQPSPISAVDLEEERYDYPFSEDESELRKLCSQKFKRIFTFC